MNNIFSDVLNYQFYLFQNTGNKPYRKEFTIHFVKTKNILSMGSLYAIFKFFENYFSIKNKYLGQLKLIQKNLKKLYLKF